MARFKKDYNSYFISVTQLLCSIATLSMIIGFTVLLGGNMSDSALTTGTVFLIISGLLVLAYFIMSCISINQTS